MWSFWEKESFIKEPDLVIVGSGIVGLSAAIDYKIKFPNHDVLIIETGVLPSGASTKNAGFACFGSPTEVLMDLENHTENEVISLIEKRIKGLENLKQLLGTSNIEYESPGSFELFSNADSKFELVKDKLEYLNQLIKTDLGFAPYAIHQGIIKANGFRGFSHAVQIHGEGQINTGTMIHSLISLAQSKGIRMLNGITVQNFELNSDSISIITNHGDIKAQKCIIATNGFAKNLLPEIDVKPARAQVLITKPISNLKIKGTYHFDEGYYYFRNVGDRILIGGGRNLDFQKETTTSQGLNPEIQNQLDQILRNQILPNQPFEIEQRWTGIMGIGTTKKVICKSINERLFVSVRLGGMGIAIGSMIGKEVVNLMIKK
ncbi:MAG: FAD-binding oxidoreductase [Reichenbachiella sp.]